MYVIMAMRAYLNFKGIGRVHKQLPEVNKIYNIRMYTYTLTHTSMHAYIKA